MLSSLSLCIGAWSDDEAKSILRIETDSNFTFEKLSDKELESTLSALIFQYTGLAEHNNYEIKLLESTWVSPTEIKTMFEQHPDIMALKEEFQAYFVDWGDLKRKR